MVIKTTRPKKVAVITKDAYKNKYFISPNWKFKDAKKFVSKYRKSGIYGKVLTINQYHKIKNIKHVTQKKIAAITKKR